ncbi:hypothetical protein DMENIID0001_134790 [Sergentomyia squamirostris]
MVLKRVLQCLVILITLFVNLHGSISESRRLSFRLNNTTEPIAYELWLETRIHEKIFDYNGTVKIALRALEATKSIELNSEYLTLGNYTLVDHLNNFVKILNTNELKNERIYKFNLDDALKVGQNYILEINFNGTLHSYPRGLCYSRYVDENGEVNYALTSHMHVSNARVAFPCYDEPRFRTPFLIHLTHHSSLTAASNMPISSVEHLSNEMVMTTFENTVSMSPNLLAFSVSKYIVKSLEMPSKNFNVSILFPRHFSDEVDFALDFIIFMLEKLEEYFGVGYPLPKFDVIVVNNFLHAGMESWGLMVFDPRYLLFKRDYTSPSQMMAVAKTICHHLVHNYFGNLVGLSWWSYAWMTEGFCNYYETVFTQIYLKDYPIEEIFVVDDLERSLAEDSLIVNRPLIQYVETQNQIESLYEFTTTGKASSILRMCDYFLGKNTFQKGLQKYIQKMSFKTAEPEDLYGSLQEAADEDCALSENVNIEDIFKSWTEQPGYPLLTVVRLYQTNEIVINQRRFLSSREEVDSDGLSWFISLSISTAHQPDMNDTKPLTWLHQGTREIVLAPSENRSWSSEEWILFNVQQTGYYRVNYDPQNWRMLATELHRGPPFAIGPLNRAQLIDDVFNLAYSDIVGFELTFDIIKYLRYEHDFEVWVAADRHLLNMIRRLEGPSYELFFGRFLEHLTDEHLDRLDVFPNTRGKDTPRITFLRPIIADLACRAHAGKCLTATRIMVTAEALTGVCMVPMEQASVYYCHGLKNANEKTFNYFWKKLQSMTSEQERMQLTYALPCYHDPEIVYSILHSLADPMNDIDFTNLERYHLLVTAIRNGHMRVVMKFLRNDHININKTFYFNIRMEHILKEMATYVQEEEKEEFEAIADMFFENNYITQALLNRVRMDMEYHLTWIKENKGKIENWIQNYFEPKSSVSNLIHSRGTLFLICSIMMLF